MIINILDYSNGSVLIVKAPDDITNNNVEKYLSELYNMDEISYMCTTHVNLEVNTL